MSVVAELLGVSVVAELHEVAVKRAELLDVGRVAYELEAALTMDGNPRQDAATEVRNVVNMSLKTPLRIDRHACRSCRTACRGR